MTRVICDVTNKTISNAERGVNYVTYKNRTLSMDAKEEIEKEVKDIMMNKDEYTMKEYQEVFEQILEKKCK